MKVYRELQQASRERHAPRTRLEDLEELGPQLSEEQLRAVAGGYFASAARPTGGSCGGCH
jgi:hypothetical protein